MKIYQIELTNACQLKCSFCPRTEHWAKRPVGFMKKALISKIDWSETEYVELQFSGEPTLHSKISSIIQGIKSKGVKVGFSTNGVKLDLLKSIVNEVDAVTVNEDTFRNPVLKGFKNVFVQSLGVSYPIEDYSHQVLVRKYPECTTPFDYVSVQWDGDVVPCCKAHGKEVVFGNLYKESFENIMKGVKRSKFLNLKKQKKKNLLCEFCSSPNPHEIHKGIMEKI